MTAFPKPSELSFKIVSIKRLLEWIGSEELSPGHLTHALEELGRRSDASSVSVIVASFSHPSPIVREGAIIGIARYWSKRHTQSMTTKDLFHNHRERLLEVMLSDGSPACRLAAQEALQGALSE